MTALVAELADPPPTLILNIISSLTLLHNLPTFFLLGYPHALDI